MSNVFKLFRSVPLRLSVPNLNSKCLSTKPDMVKEGVKEDAAPSVEDIMRGPVHTPTDFDKRILLFAGRFKKTEDIPKNISHATMDKARNKARIKFANYMMLATAVACIGVAISGRRAAERGESVHQMNLDWHKEMNKK